MKSYRGKVAAITGAASGIGRALALALAGRGATVALSDVDEVGLAETERLVSQGGGRATTARVDVADRIHVHAWADEVAAEHGKVNLILNNAGVAVASTIEDVSYEDFEWILNINFWGVVHGTKAFLPHLKASGDGHVVNISSVFGLVGVPTQGTYNATKFAVRGFTEALRQELEIEGAPVSASSVHPGGIKTNIARSGRVSQRLVGARGKGDATGAWSDKLFITTAERAANTILSGVLKNHRRILVGPDAHVLDALVRLSPSGAQSALVLLGKRITRRRS
jgi:NAD(P)-dependent dehydrogenase (short-subunit alcohol dehydrogenase family)